MVFLPFVDFGFPLVATTKHTPTHRIIIHQLLVQVGAELLNVNLVLSGGTNDTLRGLDSTVDTVHPVLRFYHRSCHRCSCLFFRWKVSSEEVRAVHLFFLALFCLVERFVKFLSFASFQLFLVL